MTKMGLLAAQGKLLVGWFVCLKVCICKNPFRSPSICSQLHRVRALDSYYCQPYLHPNGRPPLPLPRQAPQLLPAGDSLDDECGGLGAGPGWHRRQLEGACAHGRAVQPVRGATAPGWALCCSEALVGRVSAALGGDGDAGWGLASRRDRGRGLSEVEGCKQGRRMQDGDGGPAFPDSRTHVVQRTLQPTTTSGLILPYPERSSLRNWRPGTDSILTGAGPP